jgi:hypothetical protein
MELKQLVTVVSETHKTGMIFFPLLIFNVLLLELFFDTSIFFHEMIMVWDV